jgi:hypothetical protein
MYYEKYRENEYSFLDKNLFIHKPIENEELIKKINKFINISSNLNHAEK